MRVVLRITSCFIIGENLIWRFFTIRQTAKLKSSPNFPAIRYMDTYRVEHSEPLISPSIAGTSGTSSNVELEGILISSCTIKVVIKIYT